MMQIFAYIRPQNYFAVVHELIRLAFPEAHVSQANDEAMELLIELIWDSNTDQVYCHISGARGEWSQSWHLDCRSEAERRRFLRLALYHGLSAYGGHDFNPYGILTGVRPVKVIHRMLDQKLNQVHISRILEHDYAMSRAKSSLLQQVAGHNRALLEQQMRDEKGIGLYVGVPFCPVKCYYCSFPGAVLSDYEKQLAPFLRALEQEIIGVSQALKRRGYHLVTLYLGGGTPTILKHAELERLLNLLGRSFDGAEDLEFTVEAGRPDTLDEDKLQILRVAGVNRICVNPQTMQDQTLQRIGRAHDAASVLQALELVHKVGFDSVNMDLILGLPGEGVEQHRDTGEQILALRPDNITVHSLAVKRGSIMAEREGRERVNEQFAAVGESIDWFRECLQQAGYRPYYLYRQKYMKANVENIGYALPDKLCRYNVQIMEERQSIVALGGGGSSKFVRRADWTLSHFHNPKDPDTYCRDIERLISAKVDKLGSKD